MITKIVPLKKITTIKQKGDIEVNFIENKKELSKIDYVIGNGSNLIVKSFKPVYKLSRNFVYINRVSDSKLIIGAATPINRVISYCIRNELSCIEFLAGVPATIGGAVFMNAGAFGKEILDITEYIEIFDGGTIKIVKPSGFEYRKSNLKGIILEVQLKAEIKKRELIAKEVSSFIKHRLKTAHLKNTFGSVFKNPNNTKAGWLLEKAGIKGYKRNSVMFSKKHANYIISNGNANIEDILFLIEEAKTRVIKTFGIELEEEVITI